MTAVVAALSIVVLLLAVLVVGLLRSHAGVLRRLHELGAGLEPDPGAPTPARRPTGATGGAGGPRRDVPDGRRAVDVAGVTPEGDPVAIRVLDVEHDTLLVFLSGGCTTCVTFWEDLADPSLPGDLRAVIVTRGVEEESPSAVQQLAPPGATVVMSSEVWSALQIPGSPFVVHVDGPSGRVRGEGTAASWQQVLDLFLRADGEAGMGWSKAGADRRREQALDRLLLEAGVAPGDPSLHGSDGAGSPPPAGA